MALTKISYRALAWSEQQLVADSLAAVRVDEPGQAPVLWFPRMDVCLQRDGTGTDSKYILSQGTAELLGYVALDPDRMRFELIDTVNGEVQQQVSVKRFPNWGDAVDLIDMIDVRHHDAGTYTSVARADWRRPVVEASQMLGQAIVAAMRHSGGRRVVSAAMIFMRVADSRLPLTFVVDVLTHGRTFSSLAVRVEQNDRLCASGTMLLDATAPDVIRHTVAAPDVAGPYDCPAHDMGVTGRDIRVVDGAYTGDPAAAVGPPILDAWVRFRDVPSDPAIHAGLLAQFCGHLSIGAALRAHAGVGEQQAHVSLSTGINAISISFHSDVRADQWILYHHLSTAAGDGMTHSECRAHDELGNLVASFTVDAMVRGFAGGTSGDYRSSM